MQNIKPYNINKVNLLIDFVIFLVFLVTMSPRFSGIAVHEWLSIAFVAAIITHLLLHWQWIVKISQRLFDKMPGKTRWGYLINVLLFVDMTIIIFTGLMISEAALPALGISVVESFQWRQLHDTSANLSLFLMGLHVAIHWQWIVNVVKRYVLLPLRPRHLVPQPELLPIPVQKEG